MNATTQFKNLWQSDRPAAMAFAKTYVAAERDLFAQFEGISLETVVGLVSDYRNSGREEERILADMWIQFKFGPQKIVGKMEG